MGYLQSELEFIENFKSIVRSGMSYAQRAHDYLLDEETDNTIALAYLNIAAAKFSSAEAIYYARYEDLRRKETEKIFHLFDVFTLEFLANARKHHAHHWTDLEFEQLKDAYSRSAFTN